ncbi:MAG TPA: DUF2946 family protein [Xanthobacteraceae bacterium]|nr:DUF2946 family protein [Xanthobacteraceae bacterium]
MQKHFSKRPLRKRLIALAAAYAIALAGLIANFGGAQMAAAAAGQPGGIICHTDLTGQPAPSQDGGNGKTCTDDCCTGCLMLMAALPPPPVNAVAIPQSASARIVPRPIAALASGPETTSHRSRAPPLTA